MSIPLPPVDSSGASRRPPSPAGAVPTLRRTQYSKLSAIKDQQPISTSEALPPLGHNSLAVEPSAEETQALQMLNACWAARSSLVAHEAVNEKKLVSVLEKTRELFDLLQSQPALKQKLFAENGIRTTKATLNEFTPVVKLVFGSEKRTNVTRYAAALRYVAENQTGDEDETFAGLIKEGGGVVECARVQSERDRSPAAQQAFLKREAHHEALRASGIAVPAGALRRSITAPLVTLLVEQTDDGQARVIGLREEKNKRVASRYSKLAPKP